MRISILLIFMSLGLVLNAQKTGLKLYPDLEDYTFGNLYPYKDGFVSIAYQGYIKFGLSIPPGKLVYLDHEGNVIDTFNLRNYIYSDFIVRDSTLLLPAVDYLGGKVSGEVEYIVEITDLKGKLIKENRRKNLKTKIENWTKIEDAKNESLVYLSLDRSGPDTSLLYSYNWSSEEFNVKETANTYPFANSFFKLPNQQGYLVWHAFGLNHVDTSFNYISSLSQKNKGFAKGGTILKDEKNGGYIGFGSLRFTPNGDPYELAMVAINDSIKTDTIDIIQHQQQEDNIDYQALNQAFCKSGNAYYGAGMWDLFALLFYEVDTVRNDVVIVKYDLDRNRVWVKTLGGDRRYIVHGILPYNQDEILLYGYSRQEDNDYKYLPFMMFIDSEGQLTNSYEPEQAYYDFTLFGNPGTTALRLNTQFKQMDVTMNVSDMTGRLMSNTPLQQGMNTLNTSDWPTGNYIITLVDNKQKILWTQQWMKAQ